MNIQVGEYVRTKQGHIAKLVKTIDNKVIVPMYEFDKCLGEKCNTYIVPKGVARNIITKHSFDIKDLVEVGDLVNGELVELSHDGVPSFYIPEYGDLSIKEVCVEVKDIVTHEMLEKTVYRVEE